MAEIQVPGIGRVRIAGEAPSEIEEQRIRGELARRAFGQQNPDAIGELERRTGQQFNVSPAPTDIPAEAIPAPEGEAPADGERPLSPGEIERNMPRMSPGGPVQPGPPARTTTPQEEAFDEQMTTPGAAMPGSPTFGEEMFERSMKKAGITGPREDIDKALGATARLAGPAVGSVIGMQRGAQVGAAFGPVGRAIGAVAGGAIGFATVDTTQKAAEDFIKNGRLPTPGKTMERYGQAIKDDLTGQAIVTGAIGAVRGAGNIALRMFSSLLGTASPTVREAIQQAQRSGIDLGAADFNSPLARGIAKTLLVIPVVSTPVKREASVKAAQVSRSAESVLDDIAPAVDLARLSTRIERGAMHFWKQRRDVYEGMKTGLAQRVVEAGNPAIVSGDAVRGRMFEFLNNFRSNSADLPAHMRPGETGFTGSQALDEYILKLFPPERRWMTVPEANAAIRDIRIMFQRHGGQNGVMSEQNAAIAHGLDNAWKTGLTESFAQFRQGMADLIRNPTALQVNADTYRHYLGVRQAIMNTGRYSTPQDVVRLAGDLDIASQALRQEWSNIKALEMSVAGKVISRIDKNFFRAGVEKPGSVEFDSIAQAVLSNPHLMRSPQFISDLSQLVGRDNVRFLARAHIANALFPRGDQATMLRSLQGVPGTEGVLARRHMLAPPGAGGETIPLMDAGNARTVLGLTASAEQGAQRGSSAALARLLQGTGVTPSRLRDLIDTAERIQGSPMGDSSAFLARRVVLGGQATLPRFGAADVAGGAASSVMFATVLPGFAARSLGNLLSTPRGLRLLTEGMRDFERTRNVGNFLRRVGEALPEDERIATIDAGNGQTRRVGLKDLERIMKEADKEADSIIQDLEKRSR